MAKRIISTTVRDSEDKSALIDYRSAIPYLQGKYDPTVTYVRNEISYPIVKYGELYYYLNLVGKHKLPAGKTPASDYAANKENATWVLADNFKVLMADIAFAEFAKMDSFVFHKGKMFSQEGTLNGVAGSVDYTNKDHKPNFEVDGFSGKVKMKDADIEGTITGSVFTSKDGKVVVDGISNQIYLKDADSDNVRTVLSPRKLPLSPASYFGSSSPTNVSLRSLQKTYSSDSSSVTLVTIPSDDSSAYQITIPSITMMVDVSHPGSLGGPSGSIMANFAEMRLEICKDGILQYDVSSVSIMSEEQLESLIFPLKSYTFTIQGSGTWSVRVTHVHTINTSPSSSMGRVMDIDGNAVVAKVVNSSAIGSNGMIIATSGTEYTYMVGNTYEVRRGNVGFRITSAGVQKSSNMQATTPTWNNI